MKSYFIFGIWFIALSIPATYLAGIHTFSLLPSTQTNLANLLPLKKANDMQVLHFLGVDCECSKNVYQRLLKRKPADDVNERIYLIGEEKNWELKLKQNGYDVVTGDRNEFSEKYQINAIPQLTVFGFGDRIIYSGGYTSKRGQKVEIEDQQIIAELKSREKRTKQRPIFGCLNGTLNQKKADPLGLKYSFKQRK